MDAFKAFARDISSTKLVNLLLSRIYLYYLNLIFLFFLLANSTVLPRELMSF